MAVEQKPKTTLLDDAKQHLQEALAKTDMSEKIAALFAMNEEIRISRAAARVNADLKYGDKLWEAVGERAVKVGFGAGVLAAAGFIGLMAATTSLILVIPAGLLIGVVTGFAAEMTVSGTSSKGKELEKIHATEKDKLDDDFTALNKTLQMELDNLSQKIGVEKSPYRDIFNLHSKILNTEKSLRSEQNRTRELQGRLDEIKDQRISDAAKPGVDPVFVLTRKS